MSRENESSKTWTQLHKEKIKRGFLGMHHARAEQKGALGSSGCAQVLTYIHHLNAADYEPVSAVNTIVMHFLTRMQVPLCVGVLGLFGRRACNWLSCSSRALQHSRREDDR